MESPSNTKQIGNYYVLDKIGSGTYGTVKLGQHIETEETVALKFIEKPKNDRFEREVGIMQQLQHPHIVQIKEVISIPQKRTACIVMEYCPGGDLFELITKKGRLQEGEAAKFLRQILLALAHCNEHLIIHRDMKPENILLDESRSNIKVADFGFSRYMNPGQFLTSNCGSPLYTAPEIMRGDSYIGPEVDIFSAGVILYAMLSGCIPWAGDTLQEQLTHTIKADYVPLRRVSKGCAQVIDRMLTFDPKKRATVPELLAHPWVSQGTRTRLSARWLPNGITPPTSIDTEIIDKLVQLKFDRQEILDSLANPSKTYDYVVNLYFLLLEEKRHQPRKLTLDSSDITPNGSDNSQGSQEGEDEGEDVTPSPRNTVTDEGEPEAEVKADDVPSAVVDFALGATPVLTRTITHRTLLELTSNSNYQLKFSVKETSQLKNILESKLKDLGVTYELKHSKGLLKKKQALVFSCKTGTTKFYIEIMELSPKDSASSKSRVVIPQFRKGSRTLFTFISNELSTIVS
eukprot:CAMPEP_0168561784 /NCGR_PEP_ID=MMETSP0413-20121227/11778_1 /TAXON_ID=136452 /ORGANISM="Filamoeba nolandi, Strain NC-AS-23-1" /LENGTH=516 /DNA_ID=CAMNT_0008593175 /DNA_START=26 /DNA_END=1576 /DNA_ORIENTATION=+